MLLICLVLSTLPAKRHLGSAQAASSTVLRSSYPSPSLPAGRNSPPRDYSILGTRGTVVFDALGALGEAAPDVIIMLACDLVVETPIVCGALPALSRSPKACVIGVKLCSRACMSGLLPSL